MYKCLYFKIHELVPPDIYYQYGERAWMFLDERMLITLDNLRKTFGSTTVNNYRYGGQREWSGLRTSDSPYYSRTSQHTSGRAADCLFRDYTATQVREIILGNKHSENWKYIGSIELGVNWFHFDVRNCDRIMTFYP